jgi:serine/threonine protein kinase
MHALLRCLGQAFLKHGLKAAADLVPMGGAIYEIAAEGWASYCKEQHPHKLRKELQEVAGGTDEQLKQATAEVVKAVAGSRTPEERQRLHDYLSQVPASLRQSFRRSTDPHGRSVPSGLHVEKAEDLIPLLPARLPRFKPGDRPLPGVDWELVEMLGAGGFGEVWKARNPHFDGVAPVALKFCLDPAAKDRLLKYEAGLLNRVMRQGAHPGIVQLKQTYLSADPPCLEYEYVAGGDLAKLIQQHRRGDLGLPPDKAALVVLYLAQAVGQAHRLTPPIVHRDLKPANVLVQPRPDGKVSLRVADFGIGGVAVGQAIEHTKQGTTHGELLASSLRGSCTPLYASPQQMAGGNPDPRDDVYSLGVIWYQLLTGNLSHGAPGGKGWRKQLAEAGMPGPWVDLLEECIDSNPAERPADAAVLAERLEVLLKTWRPEDAGAVSWVLPGGAELGGRGRGAGELEVVTRPTAAVVVRTRRGQASAPRGS